MELLVVALCARLTPTSSVARELVLCNQGLDLFDRMSATKVRMDRVVYNTAIACCSQLKLWRRGVS